MDILKTCDLIDRAMEMYNSQYREDRDKPLFGKKSNGQWGYHVNTKFGDILYMMDRLGCNSLIDLGAGVGHGIELLDSLGYTVKGYEIEQSLIEMNQEMFKFKNRECLIENKDISLLTKYDIEGYDVLYMWQPFYEDDRKKMFFTNLLDIMSKGQYIFYKNDDVSFSFLKEVMGVNATIKDSIEIYKKV